MQNSKGSALISRLKRSTAPFIVLLCFFVVLAAMVIWPLASALAWGAVLSFFTYPLYRFIYRKLLRGRLSYIASGINTFLILFLLVLPMFGLVAAVVRELGYFTNSSLNGFPQ